MPRRTRPLATFSAHAVSPFAAALLAALFATGCAGAPATALHDPGEPSREQLAALRAAEAAYRAGDERLAELRDGLVADPVTAFWFTRMVVRDLIFVREAQVGSGELVTLQGEARGRPGDDFDAAVRRGRDADASGLFLRAAKGERSPVEVRALAQIDALGAHAVPCITLDLCRHKQALVRQLGVDLLGRLGPAAMPGVDRLAGSGEPQDRRTAAQALGAMPASAATFAALERLAEDADYGVRGAALRSLEHGGPRGGRLLRKRLAEDPDPFVRRSAAFGLGGHCDRPSAEALVAYLERCQREQDARGADAAQEALQALSRTAGPRTVHAWRSWASSFDFDREAKERAAAQGDHHGRLEDQARSSGL